MQKGVMRIGIGLLLCGLLGAALAAGQPAADQATADQTTMDRGKKEEERSCVPCHSLRIIHSQRLARAAWVRELDKMAGWGASIKDRDALLEYLAANYGNDTPLPTPDMTANGAKK
jgi:mono/diheme cytochrome c family protein